MSAKLPSRRIHKVCVSMCSSGGGGRYRDPTLASYKSCGLLLAATGFFFRFKVYYISVGKSWRSNGWKVSELLKIFFAFSLLLRKEKEDGDSGTFPAQKQPKVGRSEAAEATWLLLFPVEQRQLLYQQQQNKSREKKSISLWSPESLGIKNGFKPWV